VGAERPISCVYCQSSIDVQTDVKPADVNIIVKALTEFNASQAGGETPDYLAITVRDDAQDLVGGLVGATYLGWLQIPPPR